MGKAAMCIQMLQILNSGAIYKISELAELLETNPRNIIEYKKELEECGYYLNTIPGRYGGYQLEKSVLLPSLKFTPNEARSLDTALDYLNKRSDFLEKEDLNNALSKVYSSFDKDIFDSNLLIIERFPLKMPREELKKRYNIISEAIRKRRCLRLKYISQKNVEYEYIYHPYDVFMYNNSWFVIGWNEYFNDVIYFKLCRITEIEMLDKKFKVYAYYDIKNYVDLNGFVSNDTDYHHLKLKINKRIEPFIKERVYGKNQNIYNLDDETMILEVDMKSKGKIVDFVLGHQTDVEVIEPEWVKDELIKIGNYFLNTYKKNNLS